MENNTNNIPDMERIDLYIDKRTNNVYARSSTNVFVLTVEGHAVQVIDLEEIMKKL